MKKTLIIIAAIVVAFILIMKGCGGRSASEKTIQVVSSPTNIVNELSVKNIEDMDESELQAQTIHFKYNSDQARSDWRNDRVYVIFNGGYYDHDYISIVPHNISFQGEREYLRESCPDLGFEKTRDRTFKMKAEKIKDYSKNVKFYYKIVECKEI